MEETPVSDFTGSTWRDLALWSLDVRAALESCNNDKKAMRDINDR